MHAYVCPVVFRQSVSLAHTLDGTDGVSHLFYARSVHEAAMLHHYLCISDTQ
jgi:hypothetical protein